MAQQNKFSPSGCNDVPWAIAFLVQFGCLIGWIAYAASQSMYTVVEEATTSGKAIALLQGTAAPATTPRDAAHYAALLTFFSLAMAITFAVVWMMMIQMFPTIMVRVAMCFMPVMLFLLAGVCAVQGNAPGAGWLGLFGLLMCFIVYRMWDRCRFTGKLLAGVSAIYSKACGIFGVAIFIIFLQGCWLIIWLLALFPLYLGGKEASTEGQHASSAGLMYFVLLLSFYWGSMTLSNVLHVSCGGVVARYYFDEQVDTAVQSSTWQAFTNYFGSICFGSLLIAIIQTLKEMADAASKQRSEDGDVVGACLACCASCLLGCLQSIAEIFNTFAFAIVSIYGLPFCSAAKLAFELLQSSGIEMLNTYNLVGIVNMFGTLGGALLVCGTSCVLAWRLELGQPWVIGGGIISFLIGFAVMIVVSRMFESGSTTLFICYAEEPQKLKDSKEELYEAFGEIQSLGPK